MPLYMLLQGPQHPCISSMRSTSSWPWFFLETQKVTQETQVLELSKCCAAMLSGEDWLSSCPNVVSPCRANEWYVPWCLRTMERFSPRVPEWKQSGPNRVSACSVWCFLKNQPNKLFDMSWFSTWRRIHVYVRRKRYICIYIYMYMNVWRTTRCAMWVCQGHRCYNVAAGLAVAFYR